MSEYDAIRQRALTIRRWRRIHEWTGLIAAVWLVLTALSGIALNHAEAWGLLDTPVANGWLPPHYTDEFHPETTMLNVVAADIHTGRFFGEYGTWLADIAGGALLVSVFSGCCAYMLLRTGNFKR